MDMARLVGVDRDETPVLIAEGDSEAGVHLGRFRRMSRGAGDE
jgi:hypothetical protein